MLENFIATYGYWAVLIGAFFEGETLLVLAGVSAHMGYLKLPWVIAAAFIGGVAGDQFFFYLGRHHKTFLMMKKPSWQVRINRAQKLLERYQTPMILASRFLYGLRIAIPYTIGLSKIKAPYFLLLNIISAAVWSVLVAGLGYLFGSTVELIFDDIRKYEKLVIAILIVIGLFILIIHRIFYQIKKG
jgi:membrane protein DedA with SNARE-associated domain